VASTACSPKEPATRSAMLAASGYRN
jgi:hypothetical protein